MLSLIDVSRRDTHGTHGAYSNEVTMVAFPVYYSNEYRSFPSHNERGDHAVEHLDGVGALARHHVCNNICFINSDFILHREAILLLPHSF